MRNTSVHCWLLRNIINKISIRDEELTRVQGITQGENPETHLFDISIKDGYVYLTENGVYIGEIN